MKKALFILVLIAGFAAQAQQKWTAQHANDWHKAQPWFVGANYIPYNAINELEMWQAETFDLARIDKELGWAEAMGMNTMRVFLHDLLWKQDPEGFKKRIDQFLAACAKHNIRPMLVLFDSVWDPNPTLGKQRDPKPGVHNSGWMQSPGAAALTNEKEYPRLEAYVKGVVAAFANDQRVMSWDVWNEPDNFNTNNYAEPKNKIEIIEKLLPKAFEWARAAKPSQPLTCGVWKIDYKDFKELTKVEKIQLEQSDFITFHSYDDAPSFERAVTFLKKYGRPMICTEYLARGRNSTFETILPIGKRDKIGMINWGFVAGKTQTNLPWDSWQKPYVDGRQPAVWHHEILQEDGKPYKQSEVDLIRNLTGKK
ncbi:MAG TPA: cellulase family glycosylhydrolase [Cyclobacteriaceae bacterium]|nr:cellulase family glycosylhydrolase [Cyclobacteriaceae bacterium]